MSGPMQAKSCAQSNSDLPNSGLSSDDPAPVAHKGGIDRKGIDLLKEHERYGHPRDLFFLWAGTTINIFTVSYGAMLVIFFGLSFTTALAAIIVGNILSYPLLGITSTQGPLTGTTTITLSRTWMGTQGARLNGILAWLMLLGFEAGGLILIYYAAQALLANLGVELGGFGQVATVILLAVVQLLIPLIGHRILVKAQKYATAIFAAAFAVLAILIIRRANLDVVGSGDSACGFISAVCLVMVSGGLSWAPSGANFSRFLPTKTKPSRVATMAALGGFVPYVLLQTLGAAMATISVGPDVDLTNPLAIPAILPTAFALPFLALVLTGLMIQNATNLYSSGLNLQTAGIGAPRHIIVVIDSVICVLITILAVYQSSFYELLNVFLASLSIWLAPWVSIHILDWFVRRGRIDLDGLSNIHAGPYSKGAGLNITGLLSLAIGMIGAYLFSNSGYFVGPLSQYLGQDQCAPDLSVFSGALCAGLVYLILYRITNHK